MKAQYWKTYSARQEASFKYQYWYFRKKSKFYLEGGQKIINCFSNNTVKFAEKVIYGIKIDEKWSFDVFDYC